MGLFKENFMNKTKDYVLRANANYRKKHTQNKSVQFHNTKDADILHCIENDNVSFNSLVKELLRNHYGVGGRTKGL